MDGCNGDKGCRPFDGETVNIVQQSDIFTDSPHFRNWEYDMWIDVPRSVSERRRKFIRWMGVGSQEAGSDNDDFLMGNIIVENGGAVIRTSSSEEDFLSCASSWSSWRSESDDLCSSHGTVRSDNESIDGGRQFAVDEKERSGQVQCMSLKQLFASDKFENGSEYFEMNDGGRTFTVHKLNRWLSKMLPDACMKGGKLENDGEFSGSSRAGETVMQRVRVKHCRKRFKELSALFSGQDIQAHVGSILVMKFSPDGHYLASAGEDKIVRVWQVVENERPCVSFSENRRSESGQSMMENYKIKKSKSLKRTKDLACVVLPPKVFRIMEEPLHVFQGHRGSILDLSWSKHKFLLSSSDDKTVRLWRVGVEHCLRVFTHSDYVTCIQFNPVNDDYFISGSIDGKVRIWAICGTKVVNWIETRDIITAVSYFPDGQGGVIGSISGTYRYFNTLDKHIQLGPELCLSSKKSPCKRITSFQFLPQDPSKVLVSCADSQVRILDGANVIAKYKGLQNDGHKISASFTSDGEHIVSASEDSKVYVWNYKDHRKCSSSQPKSIKSFEYFPSDASIAIPWPGLETGDLRNTSPSCKHHRERSNSSASQFPSASAASSLAHRYSLNSRSKGSATWPEESLPISSPQGVGFNALLQNLPRSPQAWGLVIVTAGKDGRIRTFQNCGLPVNLNKIQSMYLKVVQDFLCSNPMYSSSIPIYYVGI